MLKRHVMIVHGKHPGVLCRWWIGQTQNSRNGCYMLNKNAHINCRKGVWLSNSTNSVRQTRWWRRSQEFIETPVQYWFPQSSSSEKKGHLFPSQTTCQVGMEECLQRLAMQVSDCHPDDQKSTLERLQSCWNVLPSHLLTGRMVQSYIHGLIHYNHNKDQVVAKELQHWLNFMTNQYIQTKDESWRPTVEILSAVLHRLPTLKEAKPLLQYYLTLKADDQNDNLIDTLVCAPNVYCFVNVLTKYLKNYPRNDDCYDVQKRQLIYKEADKLFFTIMQDTYDIVPTLQSWNVMLKIVANYTDATTAHDFLTQKIPQPDVYSYSIVLKAYSKEQRPDQARQLLEQMMTMNYQSNDIQPNCACFNIVLSALAASKQHTKQAQALFHEMTNTYHQFDKQSLNIMLKLYININQPSTAQKFLKSWSHTDTYNNIVPDIISYNTVLHGWARQGKSTEAQQLFDVMLVTTNIQPDLYTYNTLMSAWVKSMLPPKEEQTRQNNQNAFRRVNALFQDMKKLHHIEPDTITFNTCIAASKKAADIKTAYEYLRKLEAHPTLQPNIVSYSTILDAHSTAMKNKQQSSLESIIVPLIQRMEEHSVSPNLIFYNTVLHMLPVKQAHDFLMHYMVPKKSLYDGISYCTVLSAWSQDMQHMDKAFQSYQLYHHMISQNEKKIKQSNNHMKKNKIPSKLITKALNFVLKACAYTPNHASEKDRQTALTIALECFSTKGDFNNMPYKDSMTFSTMMTLGTHFSLPEHLISSIWNECCQLGYVNEFVLKRLSRYEESMKSNSITSQTCRQLGISKLTLHHIPSKWKRNAIR